MANFFGEFVAKLVLEVKDFRARLREAAQDAEQEAGRVGKATKEIGDAVKGAMDGQADMAATASRALAVLGPAAGAAAVAAGVALAAFEQGRGEARAYERAIADTGNAAGVTANSLADMARSIDATVGTQALAAQTLAELAASGKVAGENMEFLAQTSIEAERSLGRSIDTTVGHFFKLADAPVKASQQLNESMNYLTAATFAQIKAAEDLGDTERAAALAQTAYAAALRDRAAEAEKHLGGLQRAWRWVKEAAKEGWDAMLNVGRERTLNEQLQSATNSVAALEAQLRGRQERGLATGDIDQRLAAARQLAITLREQLATEAESAKTQATRVTAERAYIDLLMQGDKHLSDQEKQRRAVAEATTRYQAALKNENLTQEQRNELERTYLAIVSDITKVKERRTGSGRTGKSDLEKQLESEANTLAKLEGLSASFSKEWEDLNRAFGRSSMTVEQLQEQQAKLLAQQPFMVKLKREEAEATKAAVKTYNEEMAVQQKLLQQRQKVADQAEEGLRRAREEEEAHALAASMGITLAEAVALIATARAEDNYQKAIAAGADGQTLLALQREIEARRELAKVMSSRGVREANEKAAKESERTWDRTAKTVGDTLADYIMGGGRNAAQYLKRLFSTLVLQPIVQTGAQTFMGMLGMGPSGGGAGSAGSAMSLLSLGKDIYSAITGGFATMTNSIAMYAQQGINFLTGAGPMSATALPGAAAQGIGAAGATLAGVAGGIYGGRLISGGYSAVGGSGNTAVNAGTAIGAIWGPVGALVGGLIGGAVNRLFGRKLKDSGIEGDFGGETGFEGQQFEYYKGGLFRSDKTKYRELDEETRKGFADTFESMRSGAREMAGILGLGTDAIDNFSAHVKISLKGLSAEDAEKRIREEFDKIAESLAQQTLGTWEDVATTTMAYIERIDGEGNGWFDAVTQAATERRYVATEFARDGETALQTLTRLSSSLVTVNGVLEDLNHTLYASTLAGADMASQLLDLFGGAEGFNQATSSYFQNYYTKEEQREAVRRGLQSQLDKVGLTLPDIDAENARSQFKALADAQDLTTESGRQTWAMLMQLSGAFASITRSAEDAATAAQQLAEEQAKAAKDALWDAMRGSIEASRAAAQAEVELRESRIAAARTIVDLTRDQVRELRGLVSGTSAASAAKASAWIDQATAAARSGELPDADKLRQAIADARAGMGTGAFGSRRDYEAAQLILANKLEAIGVTGAAEVDLNELLVEQARASVDRFDLMLKAGRDALDEARANTLAVTGVEGAVRELYARLFEEEDAAKAAASGAITFSGIGGGGGSSSGVGGYASTGDRIRETFRDADLGNLRDVAQTAWLLGYSQSDIAAAYGVSQSDLERMFEAQGVPAFAGGGMFGGGLRLVGEQGPELEVTGAARIYNARQTQQLLAGALNGGGGGGDGAMVGMWRDYMRQQYDLQRAMLLRLDSLETLARKSDAIGVKQRKVSA